MKNMNKKILFMGILVGIIALITTIYLFSTYASNRSHNEHYTMVLTGNTSVAVPKYSYKEVVYQIRNTNPGTVRYGIGYSSVNGNSEVKVLDDTIDTVTGTIGRNNYKYISLRLENRNSTDDTINLSTILGFENGGELIVPNGTTLVSEPVTDNDVISNAENSSYFYVSTLVRSNIESIEYTTISMIPDNITPVDISKDEDGSVKLWYSSGETPGNYKVYIGSLTGKIVLDDDISGMFEGLSGITNLDLSHFDTTNLEKMDDTFSGCSLLAKLDLSSFNFSNLNPLNVTDTFNNVPSGCEIIVKNCTQYNNFVTNWGAFTNLRTENNELCNP